LAESNCGCSQYRWRHEAILLPPFFFGELFREPKTSGREESPPLAFDSGSLFYFGNGIEPVIVNPVSDFAFVSPGCAPPTLRVYLPARMERLP
jgi:hypothetical protein